MGRWRKRVLLAGGLFLLLILVAGAAVRLALGPLLRQRLQRTAVQRYGTPLTITELQVNPLAMSLYVRGLVLRGPPEFGGEVMLSMPRFEADLALWRSLRRRRWCYSRLVVDVEQFLYEARADGTSNWDVFLRPGPPSAAPEGTAPGDAGPEIETLQVSVGEVCVRGEGSPLGRDVAANLGIRDREMHDVNGHAGLLQVAAGEMARIWVSGGWQNGGREPASGAVGTDKGNAQP